MRDIPQTPPPAELPPDNTEEYLKKWKVLFNSIDSENIKACVIGDPDFPDEHKMLLDKRRLEDVCDLNVQLFIRTGRAPYLSSYGNEIYCCPRDAAFAEGWICELDNNLDTTELVTWKELYNDLVERRNDFVKNYIPTPPTPKSE